MIEPAIHVKIVSVHIGISPKINYIYSGMAKYITKVGKSQEKLLENFMQQNTNFMQQNTKNSDKNAYLARRCSKIEVFLIDQMHICT